MTSFGLSAGVLGFPVFRESRLSVRSLISRDRSTSKCLRDLGSVVGRVVEELGEKMLDLHVIVGSADAKPGRPFQGIPSIVIEPSDQGSRINVHRWISGQIGKMVSSASRENGRVRIQVHQPRGGADSSSAPSTTPGTSSRSKDELDFEVELSVAKELCDPLQGVMGPPSRKEIVVSPLSGEGRFASGPWPGGPRFRPPPPCLRPGPPPVPSSSSIRHWESVGEAEPSSLELDHFHRHIEVVFKKAFQSDGVLCDGIPRSPE